MQLSGAVFNRPHQPYLPLNHGTNDPADRLPCVGNRRTIVRVIWSARAGVAEDGQAIMSDNCLHMSSGPAFTRAIYRECRLAERRGPF
jgi:hypothetical protein